MKIIALINQKGGVGKTTSTINIGAGLKKLGKKVLLMDLDPQANMTASIGIKPHELKYTVYNLLKGEADLKDVILLRDGISVIPSSLDLSGADIQLANEVGRESLLKEALSGLDEYDYVLIDCPPSLGLLTLNALTTAKEVFIPLQCEFLALQGMKQLLDVIGLVKKKLNREIEVTGIIATLYDSRKNLNKEVVESIREYFGSKLFTTFIRDNVSLAEAPSYGKTIFEYKEASAGAEDYLNLSKEIISRNQHEQD